MELNTKFTGKKPFLVPTTIYCDCQPAIDTVQKEGFCDKNKSIRVSYHHIRDLYRRHEIEPVKIPTEENTADLLTKPLTAAKTLTFCRDLFRV